MEFITDYWYLFVGLFVVYLMRDYFFISCAHEWEIIHDVTTPSFVERIKPVEGRFSYSEKQSTHETIVTCKSCGKLKRFVEKV
jgi:hypothetical protein